MTRNCGCFFWYCFGSWTTLCELMETNCMTPTRGNPPQPKTRQRSSQRKVDVTFTHTRTHVRTHEHMRACVLACLGANLILLYLWFQRCAIRNLNLYGIFVLQVLHFFWVLTFCEFATPCLRVVFQLSGTHPYLSRVSDHATPNVIADMCHAQINLCDMAYC